MMILFNTLFTYESKIDYKKDMQKRYENSLQGCHLIANSIVKLLKKNFFNSPTKCIENP